MKQIEDFNKNPFVARCAKRIRTNVVTPEFEKAEVFAPACANLILLEGQGDLPFAEKILEGLAKLPKGKARDHAETAVMKALGVKN